MSEPAVEKSGEAYATFVDEQLTAEFARTKALDERGFAIATSSSAFIALLLAVLSLIAPEKFRFSGQSLQLTVVALMGLALAALLGLLANISGKYAVATAQTLRTAITERWTDSDDSARRKCAEQKVDTIEAMRPGNNRKAGFNYAGQIVQLLSLGVLAAAFVLAAQSLIPTT